ncbi:hypothetical protein BVC80_9063g101 [Macleaya cordata]|uniref:Thionin-like protein 2 n=1 Tax=Macleaya cordata TaxID=56857 RepID=A0A200PNG3_MACCD|nr:hypothetical protein BVC80_9063g101 [Macleaya cordata]
MEGKNVRSSIVVMLIVGVLMGMLVGQTSASLKSCYIGCLVQCALSHKGIGAIQCPFTCLKQCILLESPSNDDLHTYCKLGCAASACTNISTPQDPREEEVENCVNSCSNKCTNQY